MQFLLCIKLFVNKNKYYWRMLNDMYVCVLYVCIYIFWNLLPIYV